ncbi:hypothetical protein E2P81_ATG08318 [Venturia nashicola]|nr:hypothetical protein E2P81_ATG08318 [Venturia nashicola]
MSFPDDLAMDSDDEFVILDSPATEQNNQMRRNIRNMAKKIDTLMVEMNGQARQSKIENEKLHTTVGDLIAAVQASKEQNDNLHIKIGNLKAMVYELSKGAETSDMQAKSLDKYIENVDGEHEDTRQQLRQLTDNVKDVKRLESDMENVDEDHVQTIQKLDKLSHENKDQNEEIVALWTHNAALQSKVEVMEEKLATWTSSCDKGVEQVQACIEKLEGTNAMLHQIVGQHSNDNGYFLGVLPHLTKECDVIKKNNTIMEQSQLEQELKNGNLEVKFETMEDMIHKEFGARNKLHNDLQATVDVLYEDSSMKIANLAEKIGLLEVRVQTAEQVQVVTHQMVEHFAEQLKGQDPRMTPPLAILEGLRCLHDGVIVNGHGRPVGRIVKGDVARVYRRQYKCDANGEFHRSDEAVVALAQTLNLIQSEVLMAFQEKKAGREQGAGQEVD